MIYNLNNWYRQQTDTCKSSACDGVFKSIRFHIANDMLSLENFSCQKWKFRVVIYKNESALLAVLHSIVHHKGFYIYYLVFYVLAILCFTEIDVFPKNHAKISRLHSSLLTLSCASSLILAICGIKAIADAQRDATDRVSIVKQCSCNARIERAVLIAGGE